MTDQTGQPLRVRIPVTAFLEGDVAIDYAATKSGDPDVTPVRVLGRQLIVEHAGGELRFDLPDGEFEVVGGGPMLGALQKFSAPAPVLPIIVLGMTIPEAELFGAETFPGRRIVAVSPRSLNRGRGLTAEKIVETPAFALEAGDELRDQARAELLPCVMAGGR